MNELHHQSNFCSRPWNELHIEEDGKVTPCCVMPSNRFPMGDSLKSYAKGKSLSELKHSFIQNQKHPNCEYCWDNEKSGLSSHRLLTPIKSGIHSVHIRFSNVCNFKCRMCNPSFSSAWAVENKKHNLFPEFADDMLEKNVFEYDQNLLPFFKHLISKGSLRLINISGGEPLLSKANIQFLEYMIENDLAKYLSLSYSTNLSRLDYNGINLPSLWRQFKNVGLEVSMDGFGSHLEYGRSGCDSKSLIENMIKVKPFISAINCVVNMYSVWSLPQVQKISKKLNIKVIYAPCYLPNFVNPQILPDSLKFELKQLYKSDKQLNDIYNKFINSTNSVRFFKEIRTIAELREYFIEYNIKLDQYRNTNLFKAFPMYKFLID